MAFRVDLTVQVEDALKELPDDGHRDVMEVIAAALTRRGSWPAPGGWDGAVQQGRRGWVAYAAYRDGIEVYEVGWTG
ncbi:hypothetical protein [Streptomyces fuscichromogenes]|uniref:Uncharacterized protein n=1 Tax=Streptomyces fuscichromogenes TaxID=1324013 RepID=A0A917XQM6_9ACTN|nr:hypothetical protein [Streptomyces fuscichromogenes]GGN46048.1 hypothetical protein GCM10011578_098570 [Streptomyces fuscichromogenes]